MVFGFSIGGFIVWSLGFVVIWVVEMIARHCSLGFLIVIVTVF